MKKLLSGLLGIISCLMLFSCEKETILTVDQSSVSFTDAGGSQTVTLTANKPWTAKADQSWCKISPSGGEESPSSRITITCDANTTYEARNCTVTFTCAELTKTIAVSQTTNNGLIVSQNTYELTKAAQQVNIEVKANVKFSVEVDSACKDWIKYNATKALSTSTVVLDIAENATYDNREGKVTIKQTDGSLSSTITIKQSQVDGLFITTPEYNLSNDQHTLTVEVSTNVEFEVKPDVDWVKYVETKALNSKQIVLNVEENETFDSREAKVSVKQKNGALGGVITIKQDEKYGILVSLSEYNLTNDAQIINVEVKYNVDFDVIIPDNCKTWISQVSTKSTTEKTYSFSIAKNDTYDMREGSITFKQKNGSISETVTIKQAQTDYLEVSKTEYVVDLDEEIIKIEVTSNVDYTVSIDESAQSWLSIMETRGLNKDQIQIAVAAGEEDTDRIGEIVIRYGETEHTITVHQYSYAANTIIQFADEKVKAKLVEAFDTDKDGELSVKEAQAVTSIDGVFGAIKTYTSFDEFQFFTSVTAIPDQMFSEWNLLTSIILPESVKTIGNKAFNKCIKLESIAIPEGVSIIRESTFNGCSSLASVVIPESVTKIDRSAFANCSNLTSATIPECVTSIDSRSFYGCGNLSPITLPSGIRSVGAEAFYGCSHLDTLKFHYSNVSIGEDAFTNIARKVYIEASVATAQKLISKSDIKAIDWSILSGEKTISSQACQDWKFLISVIIPESVTSIEGSAFSGCSSLTSVIIPESVTSIGRFAFSGCSSLTSVIIPENVTSIGISAFFGCSSLTSVIIPENVTSIEGSAFHSCSSLTSVIIPESVTSIGGYAFYLCSSLTSVIIPESVTSIGEEAFYGSGLTSVEIPNSMNSIDGGVFKDCSSLATVVIPESVTSIGEEAFYGSGLTSVEIPKGVEKISISAFEKCSSLVSVKIPEGVKEISKSAFDWCSSLTSVEIPESVTSIGSYAFSGCSSLTSVIIPESVTSIGRYAFYLCSSLKTVEIPNSMNSIDGGVFKDCSSLATVVIPESVTSIGSEAFSGCGLTSVEIPNSMNSIGERVFASCSSLSVVVIPESVTSIGKAAFYNCSSLATVEIPEGVKEISESAFEKCRSLESIVLPNSITNIGKRAFSSSGLQSITILATKPPYVSTYDAWHTFCDTNNCPIYVPASYVESYKNDISWKYYYADRIRAIAE